MDAKSISAMEAIRDDPVLAVNLKAGKMLNMLDSLGYIRIQNLKPSQLLVHPENRSGAMVNPFNVHQKGWQALKVGWSAKKLEESYALEVSHNWSVKHKQLQAMQTLVEASQGMLAPVAGTEQYMSLSASHMSQFCKAVGAGCLTQDENLASINKVLSLDTLQQTFPDAGFKEAVTQGWRWHCIAFTVEESMPWFASFLQGALNASNHIAAKATEMELAMSIAGTYKRTKSLETAIQTCRSMSNLKYLKVVGDFVKNYAGGEDFPLVQFLVHLERAFNSSLMLGEEFMTAVVGTHFGSTHTTFAVCRSMLIAANLSSSKQQDGVARLLVKTDLLKLQQSSQKGNLEACEKLGKMLVEERMKKNDLLKSETVKVLGRFFIRCALYLTQKEGKGRESRTFGSLSSIHAQYMLENTPGDSNSSNGAGTTGKQTVEKVLSLQD